MVGVTITATITPLSASEASPGVQRPPLFPLQLQPLQPLCGCCGQGDGEVPVGAAVSQSLTDLGQVHDGQSVVQLPGGV